MDEAPDPLAGDVIVAVFVEREAESFLPTLRSIFAELPLPVVLGAPEAHILDLFGEFHLQHRVVPSAPRLVNDLWAEWKSHILLIADPVVLPPDFLGPALELLDGDLRAATVSFFSNSADFLSFPLGHPVPRAPEGRDERTITRLLRSLPPATDPAPIPVTAGAAVLLSGTALGAVGPLRDPPTGKAAGALADFSLRARRKGFISYLDGSTFYTRPSDLALYPTGSEYPPPDRAWVDELHPFGGALLEAERRAGDSPFSITMRTAHSKVMGLRILIDGTTLGPTQMGTQTTILALIEALARRPDVAQVGVVLTDKIPTYAVGTLHRPKVLAKQCPDHDLTAFGRMDIGHRPFQPDQNFDRRPWREVCDRFAVSILDVIGYQIGSYYDRPETWIQYRQALRDAMSMADGVFAISEDVRRQIQLERLPIEPSRLFAVAYGTEHLRGDEPAKVPAELSSRGRMADEFLLCLGTNYSHKNRDLAVRVHRHLVGRGWDLPLILAGAYVPYGSSRVLEAYEASDEDDVIVLPDIGEQERNWLLRHALLVLYPTSAEGFGLVPFEAARFGTPTVHVDFGPLVELSGADVPVKAHSWDASALADAAEALLRDPQVAQSQVSACLAAGADYTWDRTAAELVDAYRTLIAAPPRWPEGLGLPQRVAEA